MPPRPILTTRRLLLRPVRLSDVPAIHAHDLSEGVALNLGFPVPTSLAQTRRAVRGHAAAWNKASPAHMSFSIVHRRSGEWAGGMSLRWPHKGVGEIGVSIRRDLWRNGYASEAAGKIVDWAFRECEAHRVQATCWVENRRSARVLRKIGMRKEGGLRGYLRCGDWIRDEFMWGIPRPDWRRRR